MGLHVYQKAMGSSMRRLFDRYILRGCAAYLRQFLLHPRHAEEIAKNPNIDDEEVRNCTYLYEFDR